MRIGFDAFTLDLDARQLTAGGRVIHLAPKALELLTILVLERPKAISKEMLQERLWPDTFVVDANLSNLVGEIRDALGDSARTPRFVRTVHGFGYAFCGDAVDEPARREAAMPRVVCWIEWAGRRVPLRPGEQTARYVDSVLGRLTLIGAVYITVVCLLPMILQVAFHVPFHLGGTSLLIVVVVVMDFMAQVHSHLMSHQYEALMKKANLKGYGPSGLIR